MNIEDLARLTCKCMEFACLRSLLNTFTNKDKGNIVN